MTMAHITMIAAKYKICLLVMHYNELTLHFAICCWIFDSTEEVFIRAQWIPFSQCHVWQAYNNG